MPTAARRRHLGRLVSRVGRARSLVQSSRWRLLALVLAGLMLHSLTASRTQPHLTGSSGSLSGGIAVRSMRPVAEGGGGGEGSARARSLVEQLPGSQRLTALASAAVDLVSRRSEQPPSAPMPDGWLEGAPEGEWPKPYRNKTRHTAPSSVYQWKCGAEAANFTQAAAAGEPVLQSTEWRQRYGDDVSIFKWCRQGLPEEVPQLQTVLKLQSSKPRPTRGLTIVTQLSLERFQMLENQCRTWPMQISAVLYIPLLKGRIFSAEEPHWNKQSMDAGVAESFKFFKAMDSDASACILDLEVVVEERCERYAAMLYPANAARNRALVNAQTDAVLLVDVDFAVSLSLAHIVQGEESYARLMRMLHGRNAVVLPAFETQDDGEAGRQVALEAVRQGKPYVAKKFQWNIVFGFHVPQYPQGHQATDYWRWIKSHGAYPVQYQIGYEPYIMMHRDYVPFYDERFRGYYWNKVQHLMHISLQHGFRFLVHPTAFVVHVPHKKPSTKWLTRKMGQKEKNHLLFDNALFHMRQMDFVPVSSFPELCTHEVAPVLPGEGEMRAIAARKAAAEQAAAAAAAVAAASSQEAAAAAAAAAAKRQQELQEAERWRLENSDAAAAAQMQNQDASILAEQSRVAAAQAQLAAAGEVEKQQAVLRARAAGLQARAARAAAAAAAAAAASAGQAQPPQQGEPAAAQAQPDQAAAVAQQQADATVAAQEQPQDAAVAQQQAAAVQQLQDAQQAVAGAAAAATTAVAQAAGAEAAAAAAIQAAGPASAAAAQAAGAEAAAAAATQAAGAEAAAAQAAAVADVQVMAGGAGLGTQAGQELAAAAQGELVAAETGKADGEQQPSDMPQLQQPAGDADAAATGWWRR